MGQVFTMDSVRRGHIPRTESFNEVINKLREVLGQEASIAGALVCGSVVRGDHTIRSDIDCFVLYGHLAETAAIRCMQSLSLFAANLYVPLAFVPCDSLMATTRMHHVGMSFLHHLSRSVEGGGLLKGNPLVNITKNIPVREELESYMRVKMYNLQEAWCAASTFSDERMAAYLKKIMEAPLHIARKVLAHESPLVLDSKAYIQSRYMERMPQLIGRQLQDLLTVDAWYTEELLAVRDSFDESRYQSVLDELRATSGAVLEFIRSNLVYIAGTAQ